MPIRVFANQLQYNWKQCVYVDVMVARRPRIIIINLGFTFDYSHGRQWANAFIWKLKRDIISFLCDLDVHPRHTVVRPRHTVVRPRHTVVRPRHTVVRPRHTTVRPRQSNVFPYLAQCLPLPGPTFVLARVMFSPAWSNVLPCLSHVLPCPCQAKCLSQPGAVDIL